MKLRLSTHLPALGLALFLLNQGTSAQAGYFSGPLASVRGAKSVLSELTDLRSGAGATSASDNVKDSSITLIQDVLRLQFVKPSPLGYLSSSGGMSAPSVDSTGSAQVFGMVAEVSARQAPLGLWLGVEGRSQLPPPTGAGILDPPRFVS